MARDGEERVNTDGALAPGEHEPSPHNVKALVTMAQFYNIWLSEAPLVGRSFPLPAHR